MTPTDDDDSVDVPVVDDPAPLLAPLQENAVVAWRGELVVIGGFDDTLVPVTRIEAYDPGLNRWRALPELPEPLHHANAAVVGDDLYVLGFSSGFAFEPKPRTMRFDGDAWDDLTPMPQLRARGASSVGVVDGRIVVAGGLGDGQAVDFVDVYDPEADAWEEREPLPVGRDHGAGCVVDGVFVHISGRERAIASISDRVLRYDLDGDAWTEGAPIPTARGGIAVAALDGRCWVVGGEGNPDAESGVFPDVEVYDVAADRWELRDALPLPIHGTGAAALAGRVWVPGGADVQAFGPVDVLQVLDPD